MKLSFPICDHLSHLSVVNHSSGWMAGFDVDSAKSWDEKIHARDVEFSGKTVHVIGL